MRDQSFEKIFEEPEPLQQVKKRDDRSENEEKVVHFYSVFPLRRVILVILSVIMLDDGKKASSLQSRLDRKSTVHNYEDMTRIDRGRVPIVNRISTFGIKT